MAETVLIAATDALGALAQRKDLLSAQTFTDTEVLAAFESIVRQPPRLLLLDRDFAATPRGAALIDRLRLDPTFAGCELRLVGPDAGRDETLWPLADALMPDGTPPPIDDYGTRFAPRFAMREDLDVMLDGRPARLVDLSEGGAQLLTAIAVKPQQRVRIALRAAETRLRLSATVQWATFEMAAGGPRYRAGVRFGDAEPAALSTVIDRYRA